MTINIYLLLGETPCKPLTWLRTGEGGRLLAHGTVESFDSFVGQNAEGALYSGTEKLIALLPGELTALQLLSSPPRSKSQRHAAAVYLLEDSLAEDIDNLHVATALRVEPEPSKGLCLAVSKALMDKWHETFIDSGIFPSLMTADFLAIPVSNEVEDETELAIFTHGNGILVNGGEGGFSLDKQTADLVLSDVIEEWSPDKIMLYADVNNLNFETYEGVINHQQAGLEQLAMLLNKGCDHGSVLPNLLSGSYERAINWQAEFAPWRGIGIAAVLCLAAVFGNWILEGVRADRNAERFTDLSASLHQNAFPSVTDIAPVPHARQLLSGQSSQVGFLTIWLGFADAVSEHEGVQIDGMFFAGNGRDMRVTINVDNQASLNAFKSKLKERGITAEEGRMNRNRNGQFAGELRVAL